MKYLYSLFLLTVILSCSRTSSLEEEKYRIINLILTDLKSQINTEQIIDNDTIRFNNFIVDCRPGGKYRIDTVSEKPMLSFYNFRLLYLSDSFDNNDIPYIKDQIENTRIETWDKYSLQDIQLTDSSFYQSDTIGDTIYTSDLPDSRVWLQFNNEKNDYLSITEPLFNKAHDKSITTLIIYQPEYFLVQTIETIRVENNHWSINTKSMIILKLFQDSNISDENYDMSYVNLGVWFQ